MVDLQLCSMYVGDRALCEHTSSVTSVLLDLSIAMQSSLYACILACMFLLPTVYAQSNQTGITPVTSVSNDYYTPKKTFTPVTTYSTVPNPSTTTINDKGPTEAPGNYTFTYMVPQSTMHGSPNTSISRSLLEHGHGPAASQLQPDPGALQTAHGVGLGDSAQDIYLTPLAAVLSFILGVIMTFH